MDPDEFIQTYWNQQSVFIPGHAEKLEGLFNVDAFHKAIASAAKSQDASSLGFGITAAVETAIPAAAVKAEYESGKTICVSSIHAGDEMLAAFAAELKLQLFFPGRVCVHAYLSPPGTGFSFIHFDARIATAIQIEGRKKWRFADRPSVPWPPLNGTINHAGVIQWHKPPTAPGEQTKSADDLTRTDFIIRPEDDLQWTEVTLMPGDFVCLPAGTLHEAEAIGGHSLSLNVNFSDGSLLPAVANI
jgi:ribosomal protein L16 Arg81 hydroxylase